MGMNQLSNILIRPEGPSDHDAIYHVTKRAFAPMRFSAGDEQDLVNTLRDMDALSLSMVAEQQSKVVGHVALSPVTHESGEGGWFGLGPISVEPALQRQGIGGMLIAEAKEWMKARRARGCILVGDTGYYSRHGFILSGGNAPDKEPAEYFMVLPLNNSIPAGRFSFHPAFYT